MNFSKSKLNELVKKAIQAKSYSHSPHSGFRVGSSILTQKGNIYPGTNVEFDAFSLTICAERSALFNAVSYGEKDIMAIAIATDMEEFKFPCGLCRQALVEFNPDLDIILINNKSKIKKINLSKLLPNYFKLTK